MQGPAPSLEALTHLADDLAQAIADGDVLGAQEAHTAIGHGLETATEQPSSVVDLSRERARRPLRHRKPNGKRSETSAKPTGDRRE